MKIFEIRGIVEELSKRVLDSFKKGDYPVLETLELAEGLRETRVAHCPRLTATLKLKDDRLYLILGGYQSRIFLDADMQNVFVGNFGLGEEVHIYVGFLENGKVVLNNNTWREFALSCGDRIWVDERNKENLGYQRKLNSEER